MEWMNRGGARPAPAANQPAASVASTPVAPASKKGFGLRGFGLPIFVMMVATALLVLALIVYLIFGKSGQPQADYVNSKQMQAVFLNGGQVYFGNIKNINDKYMKLSNIYYLRVNQQVQPNGNNSSNQDISLVKLGCELHGPQDSMVINQSQVIFWENLKSDGQVAKAVADYVKQNPNGQQCNTNTQGNAQDTTNNAASTNTPTTNGSSTTTTGTTKKQ